MSALETLSAAVQIVSARDERAAERLRTRLETLRAAPEHRRDLIAAALAATEPDLLALVVGRGPTRDQRIARQIESGAPYPSAPIALRARIVLGQSPAQVSGGLTRAEAHRWLTEAPRVPAAEWLLRQHDLGGHSCRDVAVARWLVACMRDAPRREALCREREERGPRGAAVAGSYLDRIDELRRGDLRDSVEETFRRCGARLMRAVVKAMAEKSVPLAPVPRWYRPVRCARLLLSAAELAAEGKIMKHCVAQYVGYVRAGSSVIVAIDVRGHRSTVELDRGTMRVAQHKGPRNRAPHELCARALKVLLRRWGEKMESEK